LDEKIEDQVKKLGADYALGALDFFSAERKDKAALGELALFFGTACSDMASAMFDILSKHAGPKEAEAWMRRVFLLTAAKLKNKKNPLELEFSVKVLNPAEPKIEKNGQPAAP
jgi:hypothetical protein